jgi:hypothetical protein
MLQNQTDPNTIFETYTDADGVTHVNDPKLPDEDIQYLRDLLPRLQARLADYDERQVV